MSSFKVDTSEMAVLAEEMATFFEDQKLRTQDRIRRCEMFMNDSRLQSNSVREGLVGLLRNAEDDYSTLLHLERVLNMRDCGDFAAVPANNTFLAAPAVTAGAAGRVASSLPTSKSHDFNQDDPFESEGFVMGNFDKSPPQQQRQSILRTNTDAAAGFDDLDPFFPTGDDKTALSLQGVVLPSNQRSRKAFKRPSITGDQLDEIDEVEDCEDHVVNGGGRNIRPRPGDGAADQACVAQSLPVTIPLPEIRNKLLDSDIDEEEADDHAVEGDQRDIPKKIAEIARSLYDQVEEIASSPTSKFTQII